MKLLRLLPVAVLLVSGVAVPVRADEPVPCQAYTVDDNSAYGYHEVNNCPMTVSGMFANENWRVAISGYDRGVYSFRLWHVPNGRRFFQLFDFDVVGDTNRPQYRFKTQVASQNATVIVSFQSDDPDYIRVEIFQAGRVTMNELLKKESDEVPRI